MAVDRGDGHEGGDGHAIGAGCVDLWCDAVAPYVFVCQCSWESFEDIYLRRDWHVDVREAFGRRVVQLATCLEGVKTFTQS